MVLGIEHSYERLVEADRRQRHKPRAVADTHLFCGHELAYERMVGWWTDHEPEPGGLGLLRRTLCTGLAAVVLNLVVVGCPFRALQRNRRSWSKLGWCGHANGLPFPPFGGGGDRGGHIPAGRRPRPVVTARVFAIVAPRLQAFCRNRLA